MTSRKFTLPPLPNGCVCGQLGCKIPYGECHCGCGGKPWIATRTDRPAHYYRGHPTRYVAGHARIIHLPLDPSPPFYIDGDPCKLIPLTRGYSAIVDADNYERLMQWKWYAKVSPDGAVYAMRMIGSSRRGATVIMMPNLVIDVPDDRTADHENNNTLDNRRHNLRPANKQEQVAHRRKIRRNTGSQYKGVRKRGNKYHVRISVNWREIHLGSFIEEVEAARAYDRAAIQYFGEFAVLNFSLEDYTSPHANPPQDSLVERRD